MIKLKDPGRKVEIEGHLVTLPCRSSGNRERPWKEGDGCEWLIKGVLANWGYALKSEVKRGCRAENRSSSRSAMSWSRDFLAK
jgi:hypothetical protein